MPFENLYKLSEEETLEKKLLQMNFYIYLDYQLKQQFM